MAEPSQLQKSLSSPSSCSLGEERSFMRGKKKEKKIEFEFCKVCNLNHEHGQRHKYFPNHKKSLSTFLSRFNTKLTDIRFFLKNPIPLRPELASRNRLWCVFCETEIDEISSSFACNNAIKHLASSSHMKTLKHFLWKNGGSKDLVDTYRIAEADVTKWEKRCTLLNEAVPSSNGTQGRLYESPNDIHNQINYGSSDNFANSIHSVKSSFSNGVIPLQHHTNENQVLDSGPSVVPNVGLFSGDGTHSIPRETFDSTHLNNLKNLAVSQDGQHWYPCNSGMWSADGYLANAQVYQNERLVTGGSSSAGFNNLTRVHWNTSKELVENVHTGAPPPWLQAAEASQIDVHTKSASKSIISSNKSGISKKLNPKRVGAAWADKRKTELEMEKRGELVKSNCDANWLPNFGRVWQSGSRKESRKEFEIEKKNRLQKDECQPEMQFQIEPYISKRMRRDEMNNFVETGSSSPFLSSGQDEEERSQ